MTKFALDITRSIEHKETFVVEAESAMEAIEKWQEKDKHGSPHAGIPVSEMVVYRVSEQES